MKPIYLDYNATTPVDERVASAMLPYLHTHFGNPSSLHRYGTIARQAVETARRQVAGLIGCQPGEIFFTSGGTESNNLAIRGAAFSLHHRGSHIITSAVEHPAVINVFRWLETQGFRLTILAVDTYGMIDLHELDDAILPDTILISIMHANNEVGTLQPVRQVSEIARKHQILVHTDAAQSVGKIPVKINDLGVDFLSIAGHKLYAPKGVGALYIRQGISIPPLVIGASQENGLRPGTENVLEIVGLGAACEVAGEKLEQEANRLQQLSLQFRKELEDFLGNEGMRINGHPLHRLPNTLSASFLGVKANALLEELDEEIAASAGAACHADSVDISPVLKAMNIQEDWAKGTIRLSLGRNTTPADIHQAARAISSAVIKLRRN